MINPCCIPLQKGVKLLAIIDAVLCVINLGILLLTLLVVVGVIAGSSLSKHDISKDEGIAAILIVLLALLLALLHFLLAVFLYQAANQRILRRCRNWLMIAAVLTVLSIISFITSSSRRFEGLNFTSSLIGILYNLYEMLVVYAFIREMESETSLRNGPAETVIVTYPNQPQYPQGIPNKGSYYYNTGYPNQVTSFPPTYSQAVTTAPVSQPVKTPYPTDEGNATYNPV